MGGTALACEINVIAWKPFTILLAVVASSRRAQEGCSDQESDQLSTDILRSAEC